MTSPSPLVISRSVEVSSNSVCVLRRATVVLVRVLPAASAVQ